VKLSPQSPNLNACAERFCTLDQRILSGPDHSIWGDKPVLQTLVVSFSVRAVEDLRFPENRFSAVVTRYSFHHLTDPGIAFREIVRVCQPGGRILVCDVTPDADKAAAYGQIELLRDPSHTHVMPMHELKSLAAGSPVTLQREEQFPLAMPLEAQLAASFTAHADRIRDAITADVDHGRLGVNAERRNGEIWYNLPISILIWCKA
jgi:ubiquinone/menaquinone biosynthesis C-methylase UbiE